MITALSAFLLPAAVVGQTCPPGGIEVSTLTPGTVLNASTPYCCSMGAACQLNLTVVGGGGAGPGYIPAVQSNVQAGGAGATFNVSFPLHTEPFSIGTTICSYFTVSPGGGGTTFGPSDLDGGGGGGAASAVLCADANNAALCASYSLTGCVIAVAGGGGGAGAALANDFANYQSNGGDAAYMPGLPASNGYNGSCQPSNGLVGGHGGTGAGMTYAGAGGASDAASNTTFPCAGILITPVNNCYNGMAGVAGQGGGSTLFPFLGSSGGVPGSKVPAPACNVSCPLVPGGVSPFYGASGGPAYSCGASGGGGGGGFYPGGGGGGSAIYVVAGLTQSGAAAGGGGGSSYVNSALHAIAYGPNAYPAPGAPGSGGLLNAANYNGSAGVIIFNSVILPSPSPSPSAAASTSQSSSVSPSTSASPVQPSPSPTSGLSPTSSPSIAASPSVSPSVSPSASTTRDLSSSVSPSPSISASPSVSPSEAAAPEPPAASSTSTSLAVGLGVGLSLLVLLIAAFIAVYWCGYRPSYFRGRGVENASAKRLETMKSANPVAEWAKSDRNLLTKSDAGAATPASKVGFNPVSSGRKVEDGANPEI